MPPTPTPVRVRLNSWARSHPLLVGAAFIVYVSLALTLFSVVLG